MSAKVSLQESSEDTEDTFSDIDGNDHGDDSNLDESDEFDFSEKPKRLRLKPSKRQQKAEKKVTPVIVDNADFNEDDLEDGEDGVTIQCDILADYVKPTSVLSKYQNGPPQPPDPEQDPRGEMEEEKEWPSTKEEVEFNDVTTTFTENQKENELEADDDNEFLNEQKSAFEAIRVDDLYEALEIQANDEIDDESIVVEDFRNVGWIQFISMFLCGGCSIALKSNQLDLERDTLLKIAKLRLDHSNLTHCRMLQTLWIKLTDNRQCAKTGSHWQQIGFQGHDPSTDIRGSGLLGVLQLLFGMERHSEMMTKIYLLSINEHQHFPFVMVSFTITGIVIRLLRSCLIYSDINARKSVLDSMNEIYAALFYQFYLDWKGKSRTIIHFDDAQRELEEEAFSNWKGLLGQLAKRGNASATRQDQKRLISAESEDDEVDFGVSHHVKGSGKSKSNRQNRYKA